MRPILVALVLGLGLAPDLAAAAPWSPAPLSPPAPVTTTLSNGMRVAVFATHRLPIVEITMLLPAGQTAEAADESGVAALTAALLLRGTSSRDAASFDAAIARLGGSISATAGRDVASVDGQFLASEFSAGLELLSDAVLNPVFDEGEVSAATGRTSRALQRLQFDPAARAEVQLWGLEFGDGPYGRAALARDSTLRNVHSGAVSRFHRAHYRPDHAVLVVAGDVSPDSVFAAVEDRFGSWGGRAAPLPAVATPRGPAHARTVIVDAPRLPYAILRMGLLLPGRRSEDDLPLSIALARFAGGFASWTQAQQVNDALGTTVAGTLSSMRDAGLYSFGAPLLIDSTGAAVRRLTRELGRFAREFPADSDLEVLRRAAQTEYLQQFETLSGTVSQWGEAALFDLPSDATRSTVARLGALSAAEIRAASARWLVPESLCVVAAGPAQRLSPQLSERGAVTVVPEPSLPSLADTVAATPENVAEAKRIIDQAVAAHGGADSLAAIHDSLIETKVNVGPPGFVGASTVQEVRKEPYRMAIHMLLKDYELRQVLNGNTAWSTRPKAAGFDIADSVHVAAMRRNFDSDMPHLLLALARETHCVARGRRTVENRQTEVVDVRSARGAWTRYYFDPDTHLLFGYDEFSGVPGEAANVARRMFGDYRAVGALQWPFRDQRILNGNTVMRTEVQSVRVNLGVSDQDFLKPKISVQ